MFIFRAGSGPSAMSRRLVELAARVVIMATHSPLIPGLGPEGGRVEQALLAS